MAQILNGNEVITPTEADSEIARESSEKLAARLSDSDGLRLRMMNGDEGEDLVLPPSALRILVGVLAELGQGNAVTLTPLRAELTTQQGADILNVSRPHLIKLLDEGTIPGRKVGTHRRVRLEDLLAYKREFESRRHAALDELVTLSQDMGLGY